MNRRLVSQCAFDTARELVGLIAHNYRDEELRDLFEAFYASCKTGLERFGTLDARIRRQLRPLETPARGPQPDGDATGH
jgi:hypothetical protein